MDHKHRTNLNQSPGFFGHAYAMVAGGEAGYLCAYVVLPAWERSTGMGLASLLFRLSFFITRVAPVLSLFIESIVFAS